MNELTKITARSAKRVGRGIGSGKGGHTSGRGTKGQKARETVALQFEGTKNKKSFIKRLPLLRGKSKFKPLHGKAVVVNLGDLENWPAGQEVTIETLVKNGLVSSRGSKIKILAGGEVKQALVVKIPVSKGAEKKITKAGGKIILSNE
jgi:large subunit ribosomal protein L15